MNNRHESGLLEVIFENALTMIAYLDRDFNFIRVNSAYAHADGKESEFFTGKNHFDLYPNEDNQKIFQRVVKSGEAYFAYAKPFEYGHHPDKGVSHWDWSLTPIRDCKDAVTGIILQLVNVTDRVKAEEKAILEKNFTDAILQSANALVVVLDKYGHIIRFNTACEELTGYTFDEVRNTFVWDRFIVPEEIGPVKGVFENLVVEAIAGRFTNYWISKDGQRKLIDWHNTVLQDARGDVEYVVSIGIDVTEKEEAQALLKYQATIIDQIHDSVISTDLEGMITSWNKGSERLFGYSEKEAIGQHISFLYPTDEYHLLQNELIAPLKRKGSHEAEVRMLPRSGKEFIGHLSLSMLSDEQGNNIGMIGYTNDITERKQAEEALRASTSRLRSVITVAPIVMFSLDRDGVFVLSEGRALADLGLEPGQLVGRSVFDVYGDHPEILAAVKRALGGESFSVEAEVGDRYFETHYSPWFNENREQIGCRGVALDITERKRIEHALQMNESNMRALAENVPDGIVVAINGQQVFANPSIAKLLGYTVEELSNMRMEKIIHPDETKNVVKQYRARMAGEKARSQYESAFIDRQGRRIPVEITAARTTWNGKAAGLAYIRDIRDRLRNEEIMRTTNAAIESSINAMAISDTQGQITFVNTAFIDIWGYSSEEAVLGKSVYDFWKDPDEPAVVVEALTREGKWSGIMTARRADGSEFLAQVLAHMVVDASGAPTHMMATFLDVTDQVKNEIELSRHREQLEELVDERTRELQQAQHELVQQGRLATLGQLTATVSHELRNPLAAMRPSLYVIQKYCDTENERVQKSIERIDRNISRCDNIIDELLDFTRMGELEYTNVELDAWLEELLEEQEIPEHISVQFKGGLDGTLVRIDPQRMERAIINLFNNACEAMRDENIPGKVKPGSRLDISTNIDEYGILVKVSDTGCGIADDVLPHIFEPLYSTKTFGVGLGMPTIRRIVRLHGGEISIDTAVGKGTTISIRLPMES